RPGSAVDVRPNRCVGPIRFDRTTQRAVVDRRLGCDWDPITDSYGVAARFLTAVVCPNNTYWANTASRTLVGMRAPRQRVYRRSLRDPDQRQSNCRECNRCGPGTV